MKILLKAARANANLTQQKIAEMLGVSKSTVSRWECGELPIPRKMLTEYCKICNISEDTIVVRKGE